MSYNDRNTIISSSLFIVCANVGKDWLLGNRFRPYVVLMSLIVCHKKYSHLHLYCMCLESGAVQFSSIPSKHHAFRQYFPHLLFMYVFMGIIVFGNDSHFNAEALSLQGPSYSPYSGNNTSKAQLRHLFGYLGLRIFCCCCCSSFLLLYFSCCWSIHCLGSIIRLAVTLWASISFLYIVVSSVHTASNLVVCQLKFRLSLLCFMTLFCLLCLYYLSRIYAGL